MTVTVYKFYKKPSKEAIQNAFDLELEDKYPLYALTTEKSYAEYFKRNYDVEKCFIYIKSKMDAEEYVTYANRNNGCILNVYEMHTRSKKEINKVTTVTLVCTWNELETVRAFIDSSMMTDVSFSPDYSLNPAITTKVARRILQDLAYIDHYKLFRSDPARDEDIFEDFSYPSVSFDELALHIYLVGDLLRKE